MIRRRRAARTAAARRPGPVVLLLADALLAVALLAAAAGCSRPAAMPAVAARASAGGTVVGPPASAAALQALVVTTVPSGLPRVPDGALRPPAGEKTLDDVAAYAADPAKERTVLRDYGFRFGWERFWGTGTNPVTSVFVEQFETPAGARAFSADLAHNDADHYRAVLHEDPAALPDGCRLLTVAGAQPDVGLPGPAAFAWCAEDVFSVAVTSVAGSADAARREVAAVVRTQLERLPG